MANHSIDAWPRTWRTGRAPTACKVCSEPCYEDGYVHFEGPSFIVCGCCIDDLASTKAAAFTPTTATA